MLKDEEIRILLAEDNAFVREGLVALLSRQNMNIVAQATNGSEAVTLYRQHLPDVTLMDLCMPVMSGFDAIKEITAEFPQARIVVVTNLDGEAENCRRAGARALVLKDAPKEELLDTILAVYEGMGSDETDETAC